jgi:thioredoxin 1
MKNLWKIIIVLLLVSAVVAVVLLKNAGHDAPADKLKQVLNRLGEIKPVVQEVNLPMAKPAEPNNSSLEMTVKVVESPVASAPVLSRIEGVEPKKLPRLVDLGADRCVPCKMMIPVIDELTKEYAGKLIVEFYDVWKDPAPGEKYGIRVIPTQIFIDPDGKELCRHEGFLSKKDILAKWEKLGFDID